MGRRRGSTTLITSRTVRVDEEVYQWLASKAEPFKDGPNDVLHKLMAEERERKKGGNANNENNRSVRHDLRTGS